jgi:hypothetical protein
MKDTVIIAKIEVFACQQFDQYVLMVGSHTTSGAIKDLLERKHGYKLGILVVE